MAVSAENLLLSLVKETSLGTPPLTPAMMETPIVSESLVYDVTFTESEMISGGTRGVLDTVLTKMAASGDLTRELVYDPVTDILFEQLLGNAWGNDPHTNGIGADEVYDYTQIISTFIEKRWQIDDTPTYNYHHFKGQVPTTGTLEFAPGEIISHVTSLVGLGGNTADAPIAGSTYTPPAGNPPMTAPRVTSMAITQKGTKTPVSWMNAACFTNLTLTFENNTRALACIGSLESREIALGRLNVTGAGSIYYAADDPIDALLEETEYGLIVVAEDVPGNSYEFFFPRVKFTVANVNATGQSTDVMTEFTVQALEYPDTKYTAIFTRTPAMIPAPLTSAPAVGEGTTTVTIQLGGGPSDTTTSADLAITITGDTTLTPNPVAIPIGRTLALFGDDVAAEFNRINVDLNASHDGSGLITLAAGGSITSIDTASVTIN